MLEELRRIELYKRLNPNELSSQQFFKLVAEIKCPDSKTISDEYFDFKLWYNGQPSRQENFANFLEKKIPSGAKVLEVGGGRTARLSRFLSEKGFYMTCIDPRLEAMSSKYVEIIKDKFDYRKFDLSQYDYVIGQEPCNATEHIVRACINQYKPFMITLCGVPHKLISGEIFEDVYEWYEYLINISPENIKLRYISLDPFLRTPILKNN